jgi:hypothetical protein
MYFQFDGAANFYIALVNIVINYQLSNTSRIAEFRRDKTAFRDLIGMDKIRERFFGGRKPDINAL